jgi:hypothetical protein
MNDCFQLIRRKLATGICMMALTGAANAQSCIAQYERLAKMFDANYRTETVEWTSWVDEIGQPFRFDSPSLGQARRYGANPRWRSIVISPTLKQLERRYERENGIDYLIGAELIVQGQKWTRAPIENRADQNAQGEIPLVKLRLGPWSNGVQTNFGPTDGEVYRQLVEQLRADGTKLKCRSVAENLDLKKHIFNWESRSDMVYVQAVIEQRVQKVFSITITSINRPDSEFAKDKTSERGNEKFQIIDKPALDHPRW